LQVVRHFHFEACNGPGSGTDWSGTARGRVEVMTTDDRIVFVESGTYTTPSGQAVPMANRYLWEHRGGCIALSHLRHGAPVFLFDLVPLGAEHRWSSRVAHVCADDHYRASLTENADALHLCWTIQGPKKNERIDYRYDC
jgi:hypothetical protein